MPEGTTPGDETPASRRLAQLLPFRSSFGGGPLRFHWDKLARLLHHRRGGGGGWSSLAGKARK
jgi:hypothetical protein